jgi:LysR family transcriptional activator of nhaA
MIQNRINLNKLYYFYVVATEGSVKVASQLLNLTQPTISGQIRQLEEEIGFDLFVRKHRKLEISQRGRRVLKIAEEIFKLANDLSDKTLLSGSQERLAVNIGAVQSLSNTFINNFSTKIWRDETIQVNITQGRLDALRKMLDTNKIDILLADSPVALSKNIKAFLWVMFR